MLGQLVPCGGGPPIPLLKPRLLLGRHDYCDIPLRFSTISGRHCELEFLDGYWHVRDLASSNGTQVNGVICSSQRLMPNDVLSLAKHRYTIVYTPPVGQPMPRTTPPAQKVAPAAPGRTAPTPAQPARPAAPEAGGAGPPLGELLPCGGGDAIPLLKRQVVVGRKEGCDVVLPLAAISGRHCQLEWNGQRWFVRDLGSRNGIRVDGARCESKELPPGCILSVAGLRFKVVYTSPGSGGPPGRSPFGQSLLERAGLTRRDVDRASQQAPEDKDDLRQRYTLDDE
jgi:adenylate cyclase